MSSTFKAGYFASLLASVLACVTAASHENRAKDLWVINICLYLPSLYMLILTRCQRYCLSRMSADAIHERCCDS